MAQGNPGLRLALLIAGDLAAAAAASLLCLLLAIGLSSGKGPGGAGDVMMAMLAGFGLLLLALVPLVFLLGRRWSGRTGLALALAGLAAFLHAGLWVATFFVMAVVLNR